MKKFFLFSTIFLTPILALAQEWDVQISNDDFAYASIFTGNFTLLLSIVIGVIATFLVFRAAGKMGGGLFGTVLNYVGIGMVLIVLGTISIVVEPWILSDIWLRLAHTVFFALGYIFMVIGGNKLLKGIMST